MQRRLSILAAIFYLALPWFSITAHAESARFTLNIPSTNAVDALNRLAAQTEHTLLFDYDQIKIFTTNATIGFFSPQEALNQMLFNTGLRGRVVSQGLISITTQSNATASRAGSPKTSADNLVEEIVVTGTHIRRKTGFEGSSPVQVLTKAEIATSGAADLADLTTLLTVNNGSTVSQETGDLIGTSQFNVRGLGFGSTLALINGRRVNISSVSDASGILFFDSKQLPLAMIERIDVQTDGASSIYGSDAVGGVVNIITRKGFEGLDISTRYQDASNSAIGLDLASGLKTDRATLNVYASAYTQTRNHRTDFDWLVERIHGNGDLTQSRLISSLGSPGSYRRAIVTGTPSIDPSSATITETGSRFADPDCLAANGVLIGDRCGYNFADQVAPIPQENRVQLFAETEYDLTPHLTLFMEASLSKNAIQRTQGPSSFRNGLVDGGDLFVPANHPFNFWVDNPNDAGNGLLYINPKEWDNAIHTAVDLVCECRPLGFEANGFNNSPPYNQDIDLDYSRSVLGFDWDFSDNWHLKANYIYALSERAFRAENNWNAPALNGAVLDGSFNPFGTSRVNPGLISPKDNLSVAENSTDIRNSVQNIQNAHNRSLLQVIDVAASGNVFAFGQSDAAVAIGAQFRRTDHRTQPDALTAAGLGNNPTRLTGIDASQEVAAIFGELAIPVAGNSEVQLALRHEDYGGTIGSTTDPKISARWELSEEVILSGSWGTAFRGPSIPQVGRSSSSTFIDDPVTPGVGSNASFCGGAGQFNIAFVRTEGSKRLHSESSKNLNLGVVFKPLDRLDIKFDYWRFSYKDLITADEGPQAIVENDCRDDGIPNDPRVIRTSDGQILIITSEFINTGSVVTNGIDLAVDYKILESRYGNLSLQGALSYVNSFDVSDENGITFDGAGNRNFTNQFSSLPQLKANAALNWKTEKQNMHLGVRYISDYENDQNPGFTIKKWVGVDLQYTLKIKEDSQTSLTLGARNVFNVDPPSLGIGQRPAYDDRVHDIRGRALYLELRRAM